MSLFIVIFSQNRDEHRGWKRVLYGSYHLLVVLRALPGGLLSYYVQAQLEQHLLWLSALQLPPRGEGASDHQLSGVGTPRPFHSLLPLHQLQEGCLPIQPLLHHVPHPG